MTSRPRALRARASGGRRAARPSRAPPLPPEVMFTRAPRGGWGFGTVPARSRRRCAESVNLPIRNHRAVASIRSAKLALEQAMLVDLAVDRARREQTFVGAACRDAALVEDEDLV